MSEVLVLHGDQEMQTQLLSRTRYIYIYIYCIKYILYKYIQNTYCINIYYIYCINIYYIYYINILHKYILLHMFIMYTKNILHKMEISSAF